MLQLNTVKQNCKKSNGTIHFEVSQGRSVGTDKVESFLLVALWAPDCPHVNKKEEKIIDTKKKGTYFKSEAIKNPNPTWEFKLTFEVADLAKDLRNMSILIEVWDGKHFIGTADYNLAFLGDDKTHIEWLKLDNKNPKCKIYSEIEVRIHIVPKEPVTTIALSEMKMEVWPTFVCESFWLPHCLKDLSIVSCGLTQIPPQIALLIALKSLNLSCNVIKVIPEELFKLKNLELLNLSKNKITILDPNATLFSELPKLKSLDVRDNPIETFNFIKCLQQCDYKGPNSGEKQIKLDSPRDELKKEDTKETDKLKTSQEAEKLKNHHRK